MAAVVRPTTVTRKSGVGAFTSVVVVVDVVVT
jgi:hypothetical protein